VGTPFYARNGCQVLPGVQWLALMFVKLTVKICTSLIFIYYLLQIRSDAPEFTLSSSTLNDSWTLGLPNLQSSVYPVRGGAVKHVRWRKISITLIEPSPLPSL